MMNKKLGKKIGVVNGFKTTDGEFFVDHPLAIEHQRKLDLKQRLYDFGEKYFYSGMDAKDVCDLLEEHFQEMVDIVWDLFEDKLPIDYSDC
jgi:hypothetical protein